MTTSTEPVVRYDVTLEWPYGDGDSLATMEEAPVGEYVRFTDYAVVLAERDLAVASLDNAISVYRSTLDDNIRLHAEHDALRAVATAAQVALSYFVYDVVACNGLKCREQNCQSCCMEEDAEAFVHAARDAQAALRTALAALPADG